MIDQTSNLATLGIGFGVTLQPIRRKALQHCPAQSESYGTTGLPHWSDADLQVTECVMVGWGLTTVLYWCIRLETA